ncbi:MAG TPA: YcfL family protein [Verrucomicrobiae bacterium]|jgi:uncharacterized protein YcfL|nr:YcfL family protein [Verrucomicrobiae bacterium]
MKKLFALLCTLPALAGCMSSVNTTEPLQPSASPQAVVDKRVITDPGLDNAAQVTGVYSSTGPQGFLKVELRVQNQTHARQAFSYRFAWMDQNGMTIDLPTATAIPVTLEGRETTALVAMAPTPLAKDFRVTFFPAK